MVLLPVREKNKKIHLGNACSFQKSGLVPGKKMQVICTYPCNNTVELLDSVFLNLNSFI